MYQREIIRMNLNKRGVTFAQRRLEGRTDYDTLFSSVKYIRGYRCIQLFFHLWTQSLCIANLRREKITTALTKTLLERLELRTLCLQIMSRAKLERSGPRLPTRIRHSRIDRHPTSRTRTSQSTSLET